MPTIDEMYADLEKADASGDMELAQVIASRIKAAQTNKSRPDISKQKTLPSPSEAAIAGAKRGLANLVGGAIRGAGSIGATIVAPGDMLADALLGDRQRNLSSLVTGEKPMTRNEERRANIDRGLTSFLGTDPDSATYGAGKLVGEVAGTAGIGPAIGAALLKTGMPAIVPLAEAVSTGGFRAGGAGFPTRIAGGAISGGASSGAVDPEYAGTGMAIGGAIPPAVSVAGKAGKLISGVVRGPDVPKATREAVKKAQDVGYIVPPTQAKPTLANRMLEGAAGKQTTAQNASLRNQAQSNKIAARYLGLPDDAEITMDKLSIIRRDAGNAYNEIGSVGTVRAGNEYSAAIDKIADPFKRAASGFPSAKANPVIADLESLKTNEFDAAAGIEKIKELREMADDAYRSGKKSAGKAYKDAAQAIEDAIERHLVGIQAPASLLDNFRNARTVIAKTYTIEKALNPSTGNVDIRKIGAQIKKGAPISGELRKAGDAANTFEKAFQRPEQMGSLPQISPLDVFGVGGIAAAAHQPGILATLTGRPLARSIALSPIVQRGLAKERTPGLLEMIAQDPAAIPLLMRTTPVAYGN